MPNNKRYGKSLPSPVDPAAFICFSMMIPDALQYRAALLGSLNFLGLWFAWDHTLDGVIPDDNQVAAQLWVNAVATASFEVCMEFCAKVIDCVTNDEDTIRAIVDALKADPAFNQYITERVSGLTIKQIETNVLRGSCDESVLAGEVTAIIEKMHLTNLDFLEIVEVGTNDEEKIAALLEGIPAFDELPVGDILDFAQDILDDFSENYAAAITEEWKDDREFDLWCLAQQKPDCVLTYQDLFDYFQARVGSGLTIISLIQQVLDFIADGDFNTDDLIASGMYALQLAIILTGRDFAGMNLPRIGALTRDASPSSKWEDWDDCPQEWCQMIDLTASSGSSVGVEPSVEEDPTYTGEWVSGQGLRGTQSPDLDRNFWSWQLPAMAHVTRIEFTFSAPAELPAHTYVGPTGTLTNIAAIEPDVLVRVMDTDVDTDYIVGGLEHSGFNLAFVAFITGIKVSGTGENPFEASNC